MTIGLVVRKPPLAVLIYRALLRLLPRDLRREHAGDAAEVFHDLYRDARQKGAFDGVRLLAWSAGQLVFCAAGERWQALRGRRRGRGAATAARSADGATDVPSGSLGRRSSPARGAGATSVPSGSLGSRGLPGGGGGATSSPPGSLGSQGSPTGGAGGSTRVAAGPLGRQGSPGGGRPGGGSNDGAAGSSFDVFANLLQDLRYAARTLAKTPAFTLSAVLILAVGIGATTTIFSAVDTVVLRSLPYPDPGELVLFTNGSHSFPDFNAWRRSLDAIGPISAAWSERVDLTGDEAPEQVPAAMITSDFFALFGATPHLGRFFTAEEFAGEPGVAVLGHGIWQRRWGADSGIIGRTLTIDGRPVVVVGIVGPEFEPPEAVVEDRVDVWLPLDVENPEYRDNRGFHVLSVSGRLREGASLPAAQEQMDAIIRARAEEFPDQYIRDGSIAEVPLMPLREGTVRRVGPVLFTLLGAVGLMLLIACANVANLFLARGTERGREVALRGALGASRGRIAAQLLTESVGIAVVGGIAGIGIAYAGVGLFNAFNPGGIPRLRDIAVDLRILGFALATSVGTGVVFGTLPALQAARTDVNEMLKEGAASVTRGRRGRRTRGALVVAEIALALVLLTGAGLLFRSFVAMVSVDPGFEVEHVVDLSLHLGPTYDAAERVAFVQGLIERLEAMPGTEAVAAGWTLPFVIHGRSRCCWGTSLRDATAGPDAEPLAARVHPVTPGYFTMLAAPVAHGRDFTAVDRGVEPPVAVLNRRVALELFETENAVGRTIRLGDNVLAVIGVAEGVQHFGLDQELERDVYVLYDRFGGGLPMLHVGIRSSAGTEALAAGLREAVWSLEPDLPIEEIVTMPQRVSTSLAIPRFLSGLLVIFGVVAVLLASGGIYGSMLYSVGQRQHEMGIRMALGAGSGNVVRLILGHGVVLTAVGLGFGIAGAISLSWLLESLVWGIETTDLPTFAAATVLLAAAALAACFVPAWKASRANPLQTLRAE